jgi:hypothetical protein
MACETSIGKTAQVPHQEPDGEKERHKQAEYDNVYGEEMKGEHW